MGDFAPGLIVCLLLAAGALAIGSAVRLFGLRGADPSVAAKRRGSLVVWWVLWGLLSAAALSGKVGVAVLCWAIGLLALREFQRIFHAAGGTEVNSVASGKRVARPEEQPDARLVEKPVGDQQPERASRPLLLPCIVAVVGSGHYAVLAATDSLWSVSSFAVVLLALLSTAQLWYGGTTSGYLRAVGGYLWGGVLLFLGLSHGVLLLTLPAPPPTAGVGSMGWVLFVLLLTEVDDIAQALIGRQVGRHKMVPWVSPGKTWEGFVGGCVVTMVLSMAAAPWLTSLVDPAAWWWGMLIAAGAGLWLSVVGFLGDINISALKREAGLKDSGSLLPGMGGVLDRVDSLTFTAPAIYYYGGWLG